MIKICNIDYLSQCVEMAYEQNNKPAYNCAFCSKSKESIYKDFEYIIRNPNSFMIGYFIDGILTGILGCLQNPDNNWVDCIGPFFKNEWNCEYVKNMFLFAKTTLSEAVRFNFYFNIKNENYRQAMGILSAERQDNEYILVLDKADYRPQRIKHQVVKYTNSYETELVKLHDDTFPDVYVTGKGIIADIGKTREVFCVLDESGSFVGYGVLKYADDTEHITAEIFAVKKEKRGKGYGWALLNAVVDSAFNKHNGNAIYLVVEKLNANARDLYYSCGFKLAVENEAWFLLTSKNPKTLNPAVH